MTGVSYRPSGLGNAWICVGDQGCGAVVEDRDAHTRWHFDLPTSIATDVSDTLKRLARQAPGRWTPRPQPS